jgi:hypothetical protein
MMAAEREHTAASADAYNEPSLGEDDANGAGLRLRLPVAVNDNSNASTAA